MNREKSNGEIVSKGGLRRSASQEMESASQEMESASQGARPAGRAI